MRSIKTVHAYPLLSSIIFHLSVNERKAVCALKSAGHILKSKGTGAIFQKKGKKMLKKGKIFEHLAKNIQKMNIF